MVGKLHRVIEIGDLIDLIFDVLTPLSAIFEQATSYFYREPTTGWLNELCRWI
jgi:hypothetical protein